MPLCNKEQSELDYLRGFKKGIEDAIKLVYGEEEICMGIDMNTKGERQSVNTKRKNRTSRNKKSYTRGNGPNI